MDGCALIEKPGDQASNTGEDEASEPQEQTTMVLWDINHMIPYDDIIEEEECLLRYWQYIQGAKALSHKINLSYPKLLKNLTTQPLRPNQLLYLVFPLNLQVKKY
jgi:hypothetical protein